MISKKLVGAFVLSSVGLSLFTGLEAYAFTEYTINVPKTTSSDKPNGKDPYSPEMVSYPEKDFTSKISSSQEGNGTITTMWMEIQYGTDNTSKAVNVKQGGGYYYAGHQGAGLTKKTWHNITSENNNFNAKEY